MIGGARPNAAKPQLSALTTQVGGTHYSSMAIQPIEYVMANKIGFAEGNVIKYVSRWRNKGGVADLRKARHMLDVLIEHAESEEHKTEDPWKRVLQLVQANQHGAAAALINSLTKG